MPYNASIALLVNKVDSKLILITKNMSRNKGFTLIELLVVIAIIGILSSVVLASLNSARQKSRDARRIADLKQLQLALELYADSNSGQYPATLAALASTYIQQIPQDPLSTTATPIAYGYTGVDTNSSVATCESYYLRATLEQTGHTALNGDNDDASLLGGAACTGTGAFVSAADPVYAIRP